MRPAPEADDLTRPFWEACGRRQLTVQECARCQHRFFTPSAACPACLSLDWTWQPSPGTGTLYSFTEVLRPPSADFEVPYILAVVDLDDGWTMLSNVVGATADELVCGQPLRVEFVEAEGGVLLPCFTPTSTA